MKRKVVILGGAGLLGSNLSNFLKDKYDVTSVVNNKVFKDPFIKSIKVSDFSDEQFYKKFRDSTLVNTIALTNVALCEEKRTLAKEMNEELPAIISRNCKNHNIKVIHISTDHFIPRTEDTSEKAIPEYPNYYSETKLKGEDLLAKNNTNNVILRTNFYGWGNLYRTSFSDWIIKNLTENNAINLFDNIMFSPLYVGQLSRIIEHFIISNEVGLYNALSTDCISKYEFAKRLAERFNLSLESTTKINYNSPDGLKRPLNMCLNNTKIKNVLNDSSMLDLNDGIDSLFSDKHLSNTFKENVVMA